LPRGAEPPDDPPVASPIDPALAAALLATTALALSVGALRLVALVATPGHARGRARSGDRSREQGWDDALAYHVLTGLLLVYPVRWAVLSASPLALVAAALGTWTLQTLALGWLYRVTRLHAWLLGVLHVVVAGAAIGALCVAAGAVATWWLHGEITRDPWAALQWAMRWLGEHLAPYLPAP
jgi:hypothetical protein